MNAVAYEAPRSPALASEGGGVFRTHCGMCHAIDGTLAQGYRGGTQGIHGPNLTHLMDRRTLGALTLKNNTNNLAGWTSDPEAQKPGVLMPITHLSGPELHAVVAYLKAQR